MTTEQTKRSTVSLLKKRKLRNAEYYDFQSVQDELYAKSSKNATFQKLMQYVLMEENIKLAYRNIKKNNGSKTAGVDNRTIKNLAKLSADKLVKIVRDKLVWYKPQAIRRVEIPKDNEPLKKRPLGIPTIMDRLIQQCFLQVLEPISGRFIFFSAEKTKRNRGNHEVYATKYIRFNFTGIKANHQKVV